jgi:ankyrin repeat protein
VFGKRALFSRDALFSINPNTREFPDTLFDVMSLEALSVVVGHTAPSRNKKTGRWNRAKCDDLLKCGAQLGTTCRELRKASTYHTAYYTVHRDLDSAASDGILTNVNQRLLEGAHPDGLCGNLLALVAKRYSWSAVTPVSEVHRVRREIVEALVTAGANVNARVLMCDIIHEEWYTPLMYVVASPPFDEALARTLLNAGADPNVSSGDGTVIHLAKSIAQIRLLRDHGADFTVRNKRGHSVLYKAAYHLLKTDNDAGVEEAKAMVRCLVSCGLDINDATTFTPLSYGIERYMHDLQPPTDLTRLRAMIDFLVTDMGANPTAGLMPLVASPRRFRDTAHSLMLHLISLGANVNDTTFGHVLAKAVQHAHFGWRQGSNREAAVGDITLQFTPELKTVDLLLRHDANVNVCDARGVTALHHAVNPSLKAQGVPCLLPLFEASAKSLALTKGLLERGADVAAKDADGETPFHVACRVKNVAVVALFLQHGADPNERTAAGLTPLHLALDNVVTHTHGMEAAAVVRSLLAYGALLSAPDATGSTPLAMLCQNQALVQSLLLEMNEPCVHALRMNTQFLV